MTQNSTMNFPERSKNTTDQKFTWDEVRAFLDKETTRRAEYIVRILTALSDRFGKEVYSISANAIYQIGFKKGLKRAELVVLEKKDNDLESLAKLIHHTTSALYLGNEVEITGNTMLVKEDYCPLPRKWKEMGMTDDEIVQHCLLFDQVDKGMVEGYNPKFEAELSGCRGLAENGYCQMIVHKKE